MLQCWVLKLRFDNRVTFCVTTSYVKIVDRVCYQNIVFFNPLNAELNPICRLLALLGAHHILHFSRVRVKYTSLVMFTITFP